jgi:hypoxanthine phosphoribosyltransferase
MQKFRYVDNDDVTRWLHTIVRECMMASFKPAAIVAPSRGGLGLGTMLSHYFDVPLFPLELSTRDHAEPGSRNNLMIMNSLSRASMKGPILFIDDINDTGNTLNTLLETINIMKADDIDLGDIRYAVLLEKSKSRSEADFVGEHIDEDREQEWVVFPWENWWNA